MSFCNPRDLLVGNDCTLLLSPKRDALWKLGGNSLQYDARGGMYRCNTRPVNCTAELPFPIDSLKQIQVGNAFVAYLTTTNKIYASGSNQFGQLGMDPEQLSHTTAIIEVPLPDDLRSKEIDQISCGICGALFVLTTDGLVYSCGELNGQKDPSSFHNDPVVCVSAGGCLVLYITKSGAVYTNGVNSNAEGAQILGHGTSLHYIAEPKRIDSLWDSGIRAVKGSAGRMYGIVIDTQGHLYGWGANGHGQLGVFPSSPRDVLGTSLTPQRLLPSEANAHTLTFAQISSSWSHSLALTTTGVAYSLGASNHFGYLGRSTATGEVAFAPMAVDSNRRISFVNAGQGHSLLIAESSTVDDADCVATCGSANGDQQAGPDDDVERQVYSFCRMLPRFVTWSQIISAGKRREDVLNSLNDDDNTLGQRKRGTRKGYGQRQDHGGPDEEAESDAEEDDDDEEEEEEEEDGDEEVSLLLDFSDIPLTDDTSPAQSFDNVAEQLMALPSFVQSEANASTRYHVTLANHYGYVTLRSLTESLLRQCDFMSRLGDRIFSWTFVSCTLFASDEEEVSAFAAMLAESLPRLNTLQLDSTLLQSRLEIEPFDSSNCHDDDPAMVHLCRRLPVAHSRLRELWFEDLGNSAVIALVDAMLSVHETTNGSSTDSEEWVGIRSLSISNGRFDGQGFASVGRLLQGCTALQELRLPEHNQISDANFQQLVSGLRLSASHATAHSQLRLLDCHVQELGHIGVGQKGIKSLVEALDAMGTKSSLCAVDVSGDDGEPSISAKLQSRLTQCLTRTATRLKIKKYLRLAKLPVWQSHEDE